MTEIIKSESAKRMMDYILPIYNDDPYMLHVFEAIGKEVDELVKWVSDIENGSYPQFATITLPFWEESIGLPIDNKMSIERRRSRIITRLSTYFPITRERMEKIISSVAGVPVEIEDFVGPYTFNIVLGFGEVGFKELLAEANEIKPAHLSFNVTQELNTGFFLPAATMTGEEITVYPWTSSELETKGTARYGSSMRYVEKTSVYPERSV